MFAAARDVGLLEQAGKAEGVHPTNGNEKIGCILY